VHHFLGSLPGGCNLTRPVAERIWGPAYGETNLNCSTLVDPNGAIASLWTVEVPLPGTFLIQTVHTRVANQDDAVTTFHYRWNAGTDPSSTDFAAVETRLNGFWTALKAYRTTLISGGEHRWYGPFDAPGNHGEAVRVTPVTTPLIGTATQGLPQQVACSVTEMTDVRRRWGRFYIPCLGTNVLTSPDVSGLLSSTFINAVSAAADVAFSQTLTNWTLSVFGAPTPTSLPVRSIRVDSIPDVIRRRRWDGGTSVTVDVTT
jgi:hypothetical protein